MIKRIFRAALISAALILTLSGSFNLNRADAQHLVCDTCGSGPYLCFAGTKRCSSTDPFNDTE